MKTPLPVLCLRLLLVIAVVLPLSATRAAQSRPAPVVLATDIGDDVDDTWALVHLLHSPELNLKMVLTDFGAPRFRGSLTAKLLQELGRTDVAVALGVSTGPEEAEARNQYPWMKNYDLGTYPGEVHEDGVAAFLDLVRNSPEVVTVIAIGPAPSLAEAVRRDPEFARKCRLGGMHGSFVVGYGEGTAPAAEWNVRADVPSLRTVFGAPWQDILLTPLDTCGMINLRDENYRRVWQAAPEKNAARVIIENYCVWAPRASWMERMFFVTQSSTLFDDVAVYLAYAEDLVEVENVTFNITDDGFTVRDAAGPFRARVALRWRDRAAFEAHLTERVLGDAR